MKHSGIGLRYRAQVAARVAAALFGGYAVAALLAIACTWVLPAARIDAVAWGTIAALIVLPLIAMGCFWARSALRAWMGILLALGMLALIAFAAGWRP